MAALLALISSLSWGVADFLGGIASRRAGPVQVLAVSYPAGALLLTLIALFIIPGNLTPAVIPYAVVAGAIGALAIGLLYAALTRGPMGVVSPITATRPPPWCLPGSSSTSVSTGCRSPGWSRLSSRRDLWPWPRPHQDDAAAPWSFRRKRRASKE